MPNLIFPTESYRKALTKTVEYFREYRGVYAVVLTGSLARGKAAEGSCIDLFVFLSTKHLRLLPSTVDSRIKAYSRLGGKVCYYEGRVEGGIQFGDVRVDVGFTDGNFNGTHVCSFDITREEIETTIGNLLVYSVPLYESGSHFQRLKQKYLPFYDDSLREVRLRGTAEEFAYKAWKVKWLAERGEYFAALSTLQEAQRIFLQHLFIKERKYPIDYVKWLREQCFEILAKPELYRELGQTVSGVRLTKKSLSEKSNLLEELFLKYGFCAAFSFQATKLAWT
jgi:predicted nucleotidyltransferase